MFEPLVSRDSAKNPLAASMGTTYTIFSVRKATIYVAISTISALKKAVFKIPNFHLIHVLISILMLLAFWNEEINELKHTGIWW